MYRTANQPIQSAGCLFAGTSDSTSGMQTKRPQDVVTLGVATAHHRPQQRSESDDQLHPGLCLLTRTRPCSIEPQRFKNS